MDRGDPAGHGPLLSNTLAICLRGGGLAGHGPLLAKSGTGWSHREPWRLDPARRHLAGRSRYQDQSPRLWPSCLALLPRAAQSSATGAARGIAESAIGAVCRAGGAFGGVPWGRAAAGGKPACAICWPPAKNGQSRVVAAAGEVEGPALEGRPLAPGGVRAAARC